MVSPINLATEDELSEMVGIRLIQELGPRFEVGVMLRKGGFGYLRSKLKNFCQMAQRTPLVLITDLDTGKCPEALIKDWMGKLLKPENLLFRVAVCEIESWLLADHEAMSSFFNCSKDKFHPLPDTLQDPKQALLGFAKSAPRMVRNDLVKIEGAVSSQGIGYNNRLGDFVRNQWEPERAAVRSESLARARMRLRELAEKIS